MSTLSEILSIKSKNDNNFNKPMLDINNKLGGNNNDVENIGLSKQQVKIKQNAIEKIKSTFSTGEGKNFINKVKDAINSDDKKVSKKEQNSKSYEKNKDKINKKRREKYHDEKPINIPKVVYKIFTGVSSSTINRTLLKENGYALDYDRLYNGILERKSEYDKQITRILPKFVKQSNSINNNPYMTILGMLIRDTIQNEVVRPKQDILDDIKSSKNIVKKNNVNNVNINKDNHNNDIKSLFKKNDEKIESKEESDKEIEIYESEDEKKNINRDLFL